MSSYFNPNCPVCGKFHQNITSNCEGCNASLWKRQAAIQQLSDADSSSFHGRTGSPVNSLNRSTQILDLFDQVTALRQKFSGISCFHSTPRRFYPEMLDGMPTIELTEEEKLEDSISASFVKLQQELFNLFTHAKIAESDMIHSPLGADSSTTTSGPTPTDSH